MFRIIRIDARDALSPRHLSGIRLLLAQYADVLADDFNAPESLFENTLACVPYLWLLLDDDEHVQAVATLTDVVEGDSACLHGAAALEMRHHKAVAAMACELFRYAFEELRLHKLKAVFDADNKGARGFCLRWRFAKEARLSAETLRNGEKTDAFSYALCAERYRNCKSSFFSPQR
jgi:RimJ/RimL family protein N-acetyltransferase